MIGQNVRRLREHKRLTQAALAEAGGVEPAHLQRVEYGSSPPSLRLLQSIAEVLDVEPWVLLKPVRERNPPPRRVGRPKKRS